MKRSGEIYEIATVAPAPASARPRNSSSPDLLLRSFRNSSLSAHSSITTKQLPTLPPKSAGPPQHQRIRRYRSDSPTPEVALSCSPQHSSPKAQIPSERHYESPHSPSLLTLRPKEIRPENISDRVRDWPSRDPIEENGGTNLYGMVGNDVISNSDFLGLATIALPGAGLFTGGGTAAGGTAASGAAVAGAAVAGAAVAGAAVGVIAGDLIWDHLVEPNLPPIPKPEPAEGGGITDAGIAHITAVVAAAAEVARKAKCEKLHANYKINQGRFSKKPCSSATCCVDLALAMVNLASEIAGRGNYINLGCDDFEWANTKRPGDPAGRKKAHEGALAEKMGAMKNCWDKAIELGCFSKIFL